MKISVGVSNKHIHLKREDFIKLFGEIEMSKKVDLSQPGNFASNHVLTVKTEKSELKNVRVLGDFRNYTQIEISKTDAVILGINPPIRQSGDLEGSALVTLVGPMGEITTNGCIIPGRHIHITQEMKDELNLGDVVSLQVGGEKGGILANVQLKVAPDAFFEVHLDTDEANGFLIKNGDEVEII